MAFSIAGFVRLATRSLDGTPKRTTQTTMIAGRGNSKQTTKGQETLFNMILEMVEVV